jgi:hypothetical protein
MMTAFPHVAKFHVYKSINMVDSIILHVFNENLILLLWFDVGLVDVVIFDCYI